MDESTIPDGYYLINVSDVARDGTSITTTFVKGYSYLLDYDVEMLTDGDKIIYNDNTLTVNHIDLSKSYMVGDSRNDILAADNAGCCGSEVYSYNLLHATD